MAGAALKTRSPRRRVSRHLNLSDPDGQILIPTTPYLEAVRSQLGDIDLDPCSSAKAQVAIGAQHWIAADQARAGLAEIWTGRIFLHPHPAAEIARLQIQKLLRDYLAGRIQCAVILSDQVDFLRTEPLLLSFPFLLHLKRQKYWQWDPAAGTHTAQYLGRHSVTHYLPRRSVSHFDDADIEAFIGRFSPWGRVVLAEDFGDDWQQDVLRATTSWRQPPFLTTSRIIRSED